MELFTRDTRVQYCFSFVVLEIQAVQRCKVCNKSWEVSGSHLASTTLQLYSVHDHQLVSMLRWCDSADIDILAMDQTNV